ncbi:TRADD-N-associated membrane domain-containing protein [Clostridium sardiniense]|uniref:TRADD-N-associated membrane domain-containing protein n=1 Tax=Clostridium sardiniense TaxID=29369 RepID=UPI00195E034A|nr:hypothetical protein [Clostridium sardiniense]MBM7835931.1 Ca2+/Na+ antiporter [Clostridium sardiniense]
MSLMLESSINSINSINTILKGSAKKLKKNPKERKIILIISSIFIILLGLGLLINYIFLNSNENIFVILMMLLFVCSLIFLICIMSYLDITEDPTNKYLEALANERIKLNEKIETKNNVMDVIKINLNQLNEYYTINKAQAKRSYSSSIAMITIGFILLIGAIILWIFGKVGLNITIIATLSGLISEFIGATSLLLYKESTKQIQLFFEKLSYLQHIMLAVELSERLNDDKKEEEIAIIISSLIEKK